MNWIQTIHRWRMLPPEEQARLHLRQIPHHVALSMAMEGEPVEEAPLKALLESRTPTPVTLTRSSAS